MCRHCLLEVRPDRARFVAESGAYTLNYAGCYQCSGESTKSMVKKPITSNNRLVEDNSATEVEDGEYEEIITYSHSCSVCSHVIADHYYSFRMTKTVNGVDASDESKADELPSDSTGDVTKVAHDYYMECVLCGKGTDEQVHIDRENAPNDNDHDAVPNAQTQSNATIALANIQIRSNNANGASNNDDGDEDEWA